MQTISAMPSVMLIFPESENQQLLERFLRPNYNVVSTDSTNPDVILIDSLTWHEYQPLVENIRNQQPHVHIPTILFIHKTGATMRSRGIWHYVDDLITAPIDPNLLNVRLQVHLRARRLAKQLSEQNAQLASARRLEEEQRIFANALRDISNTLTQKHTLQEIFDYILDHLTSIIPNNATTLMILEGERLQVVGRRGYETSDLVEALPNTEFMLDDTVLLSRIVRDQQPIAIADMTGIDEPKIFRNDLAFKAYLGTPIINEGEVLGILNVYSHQAGEYDAQQVERLVTVADQLALAIEGKRLQEQAEKMAVLEDRQRLARDVHDSVSQTLFSATVMIETAQSMVDETSPTVQSLLGELYQLTRGVLAETRTILLELYPSKISNLPMDDLLHQLGEALWSRKNLKLDISVRPKDAEVHTTHKMTFYRIAQEALNNIAKHAQATRVDVRFSVDKHKEQLVIHDNGIGFDPEQTAHGLGLNFMRERAQGINGHFDLRSEIGHGTWITIIRNKGEL